MQEAEPPHPLETELDKLGSDAKLLGDILRRIADMGKNGEKK